MSERLHLQWHKGTFPRVHDCAYSKLKVKYRNYNHPQTCILEKDNHHQDNVFTNSHNPQDLKTNEPNNPEENIVRAVIDPLIFFFGTALSIKFKLLINDKIALIIVY